MMAAILHEGSQNLLFEEGQTELLFPHDIQSLQPVSVSLALTLSS